MDILGIISDVLWIVALSIMSSASLGAYRRIPADVKLPMIWSGTKVVWSAPRLFAVTLIPAAALAVGLALLVMNNSVGELSVRTLVLFAVRVALAPIFAMAHLNWLQRAIRTLQDEGKL